MRRIVVRSSPVHGRGVFALTQIGAQPFIATEIFNPGLVQRLGAPGAAVAMRDASLSVLDGFA